jgi:hypothetical protein
MFHLTHGTIGRRPVLPHILGIAILLAVSALPVAADGPKQYSDWGQATPVAEANTAFHDGCPIESPNGRQLYIASNRQPGGLGSNDIWVAERPNTRSPWGPMQNVGAPVNSEFNDFCPTPLGGGWLMFVSERPGADTCSAGPGNGDMYIARQRRNGTWTTPQHLGCHPTGPNFTGAEFSPSLVQTRGGTFLYFSSNGSDGGDQDIYVSRRNRNGTFGPATVVGELNTAAMDQMPNVSRNGREIVFASNRDGNMDIWTATWDRSEGSWSAPTKLPATVNTAEPESRPSLSGDGTRLYFGRGVPPSDVFVSTRVVLDEDDDEDDEDDD